MLAGGKELADLTRKLFLMSMEGKDKIFEGTEKDRDQLREETKAAMAAGSSTRMDIPVSLSDTGGHVVLQLTESQIVTTRRSHGYQREHRLYFWLQRRQPTRERGRLVRSASRSPSPAWKERTQRKRYWRR